MQVDGRHEPAAHSERGPVRVPTRSPAVRACLEEGLPMYEMYVALRMNRAKHDWVKMMQEEIWRRFGREELMAYTRQDICQAHSKQAVRNWYNNRRGRGGMGALTN
ncbi:hypothetical protein OH76DRAFT_1422545 [Lentinus brumalis]|uniref:Uncharacterized protein n=1 Tax=Lentinus brumalis TaxID=2498619 RepID=A0A371CPX6_9APHY|nr:hypothetical protein OH76DRAFT_1422545 [Polyporus brumalis]